VTGILIRRTEIKWGMQVGGLDCMGILYGSIRSVLRLGNRIPDVIHFIAVVPIFF